MAPPRKGGGAAATEQANERLTAVVMADSFTQRFRPVTLERPKVLLPLANVPLLDYTLEWLSMNDVEECYVFCSAHADQIQAHLEAVPRSRSRRMAIIPVVSTNCISLGDALRLLDHKDCIKTDFILVSGDIITNVQLGPVMEGYRRRRAADKASIMTLVMKGGMKPAQRAWIGDTESIAVVDASNGRLLKYEDLSGANYRKHLHGPAARRLRLDSSLFSERDDVIIRTDLMMTGIYVCAPEVLMLFSDNFDYQNVRRDFVAGVLSEEELGNKMFVHEITKEYAARVQTLRSYDAISRDVLQRWTYPLVPDTNLFKARPITTKGPPEEGSVTVVRGSRDQDMKKNQGPNTRYCYDRGGVYMDQGVVVARSAEVANASCVGAGTMIAEKAVVEQSVIGRGCRIGPGAKLRGCYLGDNVVVGRGAVVTHAMLCDGVVVKDGAQIKPNVVLSYRVVVDRDAFVPAGTRISLARQAPGGATGQDSDDDGEIPQMMAPSPKHADTATTKQHHTIYSSEEEDDFRDDIMGLAGGSQHCENFAKGPDPAVVAAALALAADGIPETNCTFDTDVVGPMGAGFQWHVSVTRVGTTTNVSSGTDGSSVPRTSTGTDAAGWTGLAPPLAAMLRAEANAFEESGDDDGQGVGIEASYAPSRSGAGEGVDGGEDGINSTAAFVEHHFKKEVAETFLRCVKENISHENVVIELNGLKIAEDKTFADCARYMLTTALGLCLPPPPLGRKLGVSREYRGLYNASDIDPESKEGRLELLKRTKVQLARWRDLLQKFLKSEEDQVELLLTLEEFCGEEGDFEGTDERGAAFVGVFAQVLKLLYDLDIVGENALLDWAEEKTNADEDEKRFLRLAQPFLDWLQEAEEESSEEEEEDD